MFKAVVVTSNGQPWVIFESRNFEECASFLAKRSLGSPFLLGELVINENDVVVGSPDSKLIGKPLKDAIAFLLRRCS